MFSPEVLNLNHPTVHCVDIKKLSLALYAVCVCLSWDCGDICFASVRHITLLHQVGDILLFGFHQKKVLISLLHLYNSNPFQTLTLYQVFW